MNIKVYKILDNHAEKLVIDKNITKLKHGGSSGDLELIGFDYDLHGFIAHIGDSQYFGQYKLEVEVFADWSELKMDNFSYFIGITRDSFK